MQFIKKFYSFICGPKTIGRIEFLWRTLIFTIGIPELINILFPNWSDDIFANLALSILLISVFLLITIPATIMAFIARLNDLKMSSLWLTTIIVPPLFVLLWLYLLLKPRK